LAWNLDVVKLQVVEIDQVAPVLIQSLGLGSSVEMLLVRVSPPLQSLDVFSEFRHVSHEVLLDRGLFDIRQYRAIDERNRNSP
jgi:hypothetical protein